MILSSFLWLINLLTSFVDSAQVEWHTGNFLLTELHSLKSKLMTGSAIALYYGTPDMPIVLCLRWVDNAFGRDSFLHELWRCMMIVPNYLYVRVLYDCLRKWKQTKFLSNWRISRRYVSTLLIGTLATASNAKKVELAGDEQVCRNLKEWINYWVSYWKRKQEHLSEESNRK